MRTKSWLSQFAIFWDVQPSIPEISEAGHGPSSRFGHDCGRASHISHSFFRPQQEHVHLINVTIPVLLGVVFRRFIVVEGLSLKLGHRQ